jgi:hypothetical protein
VHASDEVDCLTVQALPYDSGFELFYGPNCGIITTEQMYACSSVCSKHFIMTLLVLTWSFCGQLESEDIVPKDLGHVRVPF